MTGKRKRVDLNPSQSSNNGSSKVNGKPISAIAAARLKAAALPSVQSIDVAQEPSSSPLPNLTDSEYAESETEEATPCISKNFQLCTWRDNGDNVLSDTNEELTILLEKNSTVSFIGFFDVKILRGAVNINGANIGAISRKGEKSRCHRVSAPSTHPITRIRGLDHTNHVQIIHCEEPAPFSKISPLFADIWATGLKAEDRSFSLITESEADPLRRPLLPENTPEDWLRAIEDIVGDSSVTLIIGPPGSGKSMFAKRLINRSLTGLGKTAQAVPAVWYIDLDPSKPDYALPGLISLTVVREPCFGPSFTHPAALPGVEGVDEMIAAHPFPVGGLQDYEDYFISCFDDLFRTYQNLFAVEKRASLVINTSASLYHMHFPLLQTMLSTLKPGNLVHLGNTASIDLDTAARLHSLSTICSKSGTRIYELSSQNQAVTPLRTDAEIRAMHLQSYFHCTTSRTSDSSSATQHKFPLRVWDSRPLSTMTPWEFCYEETATRTQDVIGFLPLFEPVDATQLFTALNGSIIHIVETSDTRVLARLNNLPRTPKYRIPYFPLDASTRMAAPLDPKSSRLRCTALIRGFEPDTRIVQVLVPQTHDSILSTLSPENTVFVAGCCDTPEWAYAEDSCFRFMKAKEYMARNGEFVGQDVEMDGVDMPPWVEKRTTVERMGYLNTVRRVRKFLGQEGA